MSAYYLIALVGMSPQVVTELVYALATQPAAMWPKKVFLLTTTNGKAALNHKLLGKGDAIGAENQWKRLEEVLNGGQTKRALPMPRIYVPKGSPENHFDIRTGEEDDSFAQECFRVFSNVFRERDQKDNGLPVYASLAGGRKTMSAHMMTAMSVFAEKEDKLFHVLVNEAAERNRNFFFPTTETPGEIELVEMISPRLSGLLQKKKINPSTYDGHILELFYLLGIPAYAHAPIRHIEIALDRKHIWIKGAKVLEKKTSKQVFISEVELKQPRLGALFLCMMNEIYHPAAKKNNNQFVLQDKTALKAFVVSYHEIWTLFLEEHYLKEDKTVFDHEKSLRKDIQQRISDYKKLLMERPLLLATLGFEYQTQKKGMAYKLSANHLPTVRLVGFLEEDAKRLLPNLWSASEATKY